MAPKVIVSAALSVFGMLSAALFVVGVTNNANVIVGESGYSEVFTVVGALLLVPVMISVVGVLEPYLPKLPAASETTVWVTGLKGCLLAFYMTQQGLLLLYFVTYLGKLAWLYLLADIIVVLLLIAPLKFTTVWTTLYILVFGVKLSIFWPYLDQSDASVNAFANKDNSLGPNGLLAALIMIIPVIQFPVLISRVASGTNVLEAFTTNMGAVFAHTLHILDCLEMYFLGLDRNSFSDDMQYLLLMFSVMGTVTANIYYISLFFNDDTVEVILKRFQPQVFRAFAADEGTKDEDLLHYLVWLCFFIDLPYSTTRFIAWVVHDTQISVFFAKNIMMMCAVVALIVQHSRSRLR